MSSTLDPDGLNLRSSYTYYTNSNQKGSYGKKATESLADGSWTTYQYNNDGWETVLISPWLNGEFNSAAAQNVATYLSYTPWIHGTFWFRTTNGRVPLNRRFSALRPAKNFGLIILRITLMWKFRKSGRHRRPSGAMLPISVPSGNIIPKGNVPPLRPVA